MENKTREEEWGWKCAQRTAVEHRGLFTIFFFSPPLSVFFLFLSLAEFIIGKSKEKVSRAVSVAGYSYSVCL